ncbi:MAG: ABC transporter substrate-binding protein [Acetobacteraceae bacterium]|nr:ABC transporter substrate-binding protein [Acetobacteraceae bacterium]
MRSLFAATILVTLAVPALSWAEDAPGQTLKIALREDADALDPSLGRSYVGRIVFASLCDKLFDINAKLEIVPQLATAYAWEDPKTLRIELRPGVKFQDGTEMDAEAVKYSLMRHLTMQGSARRGEISTLDSVDVTGPLTVKLHLKSATSPLLAQLTDRAGMIVSPKAAEAEGRDFALHPVCAGPFKFVERVPQDHITLERFAGYWDAKDIHVDRVIFQPIVDSTARLANLRSGAVDLDEWVIPSDVPTVKADPKLQLLTSPGLGYQSITFNLNHGPRASGPISKDARVRRAFELAIDRDALSQVVFNGLLTPTAQAVQQGSPFYAKSVQPKPRDVDAAKKLLAEAGVKPPVTVTVNVPNSPELIQVMEVVQAMVGEAGFDLKLNTMEFATSLDAADRGDFEAYLIQWSGRTDADGNLWNFVHTGGPLNYPAYSNPDVDHALEAARATTDIPSRAALYEKVAQQQEADLPILYLYGLRNLVGVSRKVGGYVPVPDGIVRLQGVTLAK